MNDKTHLSCRRLPCWAGRFLAALIVIGTFASVVFHEPSLAIPSNAPEGMKFKDIDARSAAAQSIQNQVNLLVTLSLGLTALLSFSVKDKIAKGNIICTFIAIATSIYAFFLVRLMIHAYETFSVLAVQFDSGYFFIRNLEPLVVIQAISLLCCTIVYVVILTLVFVDGDSTT